MSKRGGRSKKIKAKGQTSERAERLDRFRTSVERLNSGSGGWKRQHTQHGTASGSALHRNREQQCSLEQQSLLKASAAGLAPQAKLLARSANLARIGCLREPEPRW